MDPSFLFESPKDLLYVTPIILTSGDAIQKKQEILNYFNKTFTLYEKLFETINTPQAYYIRPEPLRHPLIFYYGHTSTFYINKFIISGLLKQRINPEFESMFAVGVDEMSWDDLLPEHYNWPKLEDLQKYRRKVQELVSKVIQESPLVLPITWDNPFWVIIMGIEHERIHLETSSVIIRRLGSNYVRNSEFFIRCPISNSIGYESNQPKIEKLPKNTLLKLPAKTIDLHKDGVLYGWDNEYGVHKKDVSEFQASKYLVSNGEFLEFMRDGGYILEENWTEEGKQWLKSTKTQHPLFWIDDVENRGFYKFRTMTEIMDMPWDWPVEVNYLEAKAFCNWKGRTTNKKIRLPTEDEYYVLRDLIKEDIIDVGFEKTGNISLFHWASSCPIDSFETAGFCDILGNVWQHTETPIAGFNGFKVHKFYDDFSTPTFDSKHNLIKGGSWISTGNEAMKNARYAFRRHFFQHAGFRYVEAEEYEQIRNQSNFYHIDEVEAKLLEFNYGDEEYFNVKNMGAKAGDICKTIYKENKGNNDKNHKKALEIGCNVGRTCFELSEEFDEVVGLDLSARFFHIAVTLKENGKLNYMRKAEGELYEYRTIDLETFNFYKYINKVSFYQQPDLCNIDTLKFKEFDLIFSGNALESLHNPKDFLRKIQKLLVKNGIFIISSTYDWKINISPVQNWLGGYKQDGENKKSYEGIKEILEGEGFDEICEPKEVDFVVRESNMKFQHNFAEFSFWKKK